MCVGGGYYVHGAARNTLVACNLKVASTPWHASACAAVCLGCVLHRPVLYHASGSTAQVRLGDASKDAVGAFIHSAHPLLPAALLDELADTVWQVR